MKLNEIHIPRDGDHPILYDLIKKWLRSGKKVTIATNGVLRLSLTSKLRCHLKKNRFTVISEPIR
ncbi:MAG: hypothetical protein DDT31_00007 [Syntrophomonadaceae bacterium]|nr:hypothetical protein [Bacillota bacterium]